MAQAKRKTTPKQAPKPQPTEPSAEERAATVLVHEVDEFLREERLAEFWRNWRAAIIGGIAAIFAVAIGWEGYQAMQQGQRNQAAEAWGSITTGNVEDANSALSELVQTAPQGYQLLAGLELAQRFATNNDVASAIQVYTALLQQSLDQHWQDFVRLQRATLYLQTDVSAATQDLQILVDSNAAVAPLAQEQLAWLQETAGDIPAAIKLYESIVERLDVPATLRERARVRLQFLTNQAGVIN